MSAEVTLYQDPKAPIEQRIDDLLARMTLLEKISECSGLDFMDGRTNDRLGIPPLLMTDGPHGVKDIFGTATCFPTGVALAASWDEDLAERYGVALGQETRGRGRNVLLGPCLNIHRTPLGGRNFESFGEDPYLTARLAVAYIKGVQSQKVAATVKHYAVNNQEQDRWSLNVRTDERTLQEVYLQAFQAAVGEGGALAVMGAYNRLEGEHCCENRYLLTELLKNEWGFTGMVMSDWGAIHRAAPAMNSGCDLEMPGPGAFFSQEALFPLVHTGQVDERRIDDAVRRILRVKFTLGLFEREGQGPSGSVNTEEHQRLARETAEASIVLLKNDGRCLPLDRERTTSVAVIGPNADQARLGGGGSSTVRPPYAVSPLEGIRRTCGSKTTVVFAPGVKMLDPVTGTVLETPAGEPGLRGEYFDTPDLRGKPVKTRTDPRIDFTSGSGTPWTRMRPDDFSVRWTGTLKAPRTDEYEFTLISDDGSRMYLEDRLIVENWGDHGPVLRTGRVRLQAGTKYPVRIEYYQRGGGSTVRWGWNGDSGRHLQEAVAAARDCEVAVVCAGLNDLEEGEGQDRQNMYLPAGQAELIRAVAAVNPRTIVVLNNGTPIDMRSWLDQVPAIVEAWYPGMEGGNAIAEVLFGGVNPSGKLPVTFPKNLRDDPARGNYADGAGGVTYREGLLVGYRHYDRNQVEPLFPFGHGLSYTEFTYTNLRVAPERTEDGSFTVTVDVKNTGEVTGKEIVQLYIGDVEHSLPRPLQELKAFKKIELSPNEQRTVKFVLTRSALSFYDPMQQAWVAEPGEFTVRVGRSSRDIRRTGQVWYQAGNWPRYSSHPLPLLER